jgi:hypothetical protein
MTPEEKKWLDEVKKEMAEPFDVDAPLDDECLRNWLEMAISIIEKQERMLERVKEVLRHYQNTKSILDCGNFLYEIEELWKC